MLIDTFLTRFEMTMDELEDLAWTLQHPTFGELWAAHAGDPKLPWVLAIMEAGLLSSRGIGRPMVALREHDAAVFDELSSLASLYTDPESARAWVRKVRGVSAVPWPPEEIAPLLLARFEGNPPSSLYSLATAVGRGPAVIDVGALADLMGEEVGSVCDAGVVARLVLSGSGHELAIRLVEERLLAPNLCNLARNAGERKSSGRPDAFVIQRAASMDPRVLAAIEYTPWGKKMCARPPSASRLHPFLHACVALGHSLDPPLSPSLLPGPEQVADLLVDEAIIARLYETILDTADTATERECEMKEERGEDFDYNEVLERERDTAANGIPALAALLKSAMPEGATVKALPDKRDLVERSRISSIQPDDDLSLDTEQTDRFRAWLPGAVGDDELGFLYLLKFLTCMRGYAILTVPRSCWITLAPTEGVYLLVRLGKRGEALVYLARCEIEHYGITPLWLPEWAPLRPRDDPKRLAEYIEYAKALHARFTKETGIVIPEQRDNKWQRPSVAEQVDEALAPGEENAVSARLTQLSDQTRQNYLRPRIATLTETLEKGSL